MIENSSAGLVILPGEVAVTVTREEQHQPALARYRVAPGQERHVAVELAWCVISAGKYRGEHAIEVRLDGHRVGELTYQMSRRYTPFVTQVTAHGGRPGCVATVRPGPKGLEVVLRLPRATDAASTYVMAPVAPTVSPAPAKRPSHRLAWIAASVVAAIAFFAVIGSNSDSPTDTADSVADPTTTAPPAEPAPTTATTSVAAKPAPPKPKPKPKPKPTATPPKPKPVPKPAPKPASTCDPNYSDCVPVASDVDCAGGSGNGPAYLQGTAEVIGTDIYDLDRDGDGTACE